jgi:probable rRNA maturation factor
MNNSCHFFTHNVKYPVKNRKLLNDWLTRVIEIEGKMAGSLNFIIVTDSYLRKLNKKYLNSDSYTDTISFPLSEEENIVSGDIYISLERVMDNAMKFKAKPLNELHRVMVHSTLHLIGFNDHTEKDKDVMHKKENRFLKLLKTL